MSRDQRFDFSVPDFTKEDRVVEYDHGALDQIKQLYTDIAKKIRAFGRNKLHSEAVIHLSKTTNIILIGPPRVGKSTTISVISGEDAKTDPGLFSCTQKVDKYQTEGLTFWDTPGIESWKASDVDSFIDVLFVSNKILPMSIIVVLSPGCFIAHDPIQRFIQLAQKYKIQVIFQITKAYALDMEQFMSYSKTILDMTKSKKMDQFQEFSKSLDNNMFIVYCNLKPFRPMRGDEIGVFGVNDLKHILFVCQDPTTKEELVKMHYDNAGFWKKAGAFGFDLLYSVGMPMELTLSTEEADVYNKINDNPRIDIIKLIEKYNSLISGLKSRN